MPSYKPANQKRGHGVQYHYGIRTERFKLIHFSKGNEWELFDLKNDKSEMNNIYKNKEYESKVKELQSSLQDLLNEYKVKFE